MKAKMGWQSNIIYIYIIFQFNLKYEDNVLKIICSYFAFKDMTSPGCFLFLSSKEKRE